MLKKMPIRLRLTVLCTALLILCCVCLTLVLNFFATQMANVIEATPIFPANIVEENTLPPSDTEEAAMDMTPYIPAQSTQGARSLYLYQSILFMILIIAAGGGLIYYVSGKALKPLHTLSSQMKKCTADNLLENLPVPESHDEIADLTHSFNEMSDQLGNAFAMQKRFSQSAAHELRTPLTVLKTKVDVFKKKEEHTAKEYDKLLSVITTHTNRLSDLVKNLLNLSNMDVLACDQEIDVKILIKEAVEELSILAEEKNISMTATGTERIIKGNRSLLYRAFYNLIENAVKYNCENGRVDIVLSVRDKNTVITLKDTGVGIPEEMRDLIFEPFFRVDQSRSRQMGGAGLGLPTVKAIVEKHHGKIEVFDNPAGGTVFEITL